MMTKTNFTNKKPQDAGVMHKFPLQMGFDPQSK